MPAVPLLQSAMREGIGVCDVSCADWHSDMHLETWNKIVCACKVDTVAGLRSYVRAWGILDPCVSHWVHGYEACQKPTADIGGWLADYCNTAFLALTEQAKPNVIYMVVENALYRSLAELIGPFGWSAGKAGNVWEQLCWHAYEHDKGAFILAVIWNTSNRRLLSLPAASQGYRNAHTDDPSAHMPPKGERLTMVGGSVSSDLHRPIYVGLTMEQAANFRQRKTLVGFTMQRAHTLTKWQ